MAIKNGTPGNDVLRGTQLADSIFGFAGNDSLFGSGGNDSLDGGNGNDTLNGARDNDSLNGGNGNDTLDGGAGNDSLNGGNGNDTLDGGASNDTLLGGRGNDTYIIDLNDTDIVDTIVEFASSGTDTVVSSVTYQLGLTLENLTLTGANTISGTGNDLNNTIIGNDVNNFLNGLGGNDNLNGLVGNDTLLAGSGVVGERDTLTGGVGRDTFLLGNVTQVFYDDRNTTTTGIGDYALITDINKGDDVIKLNGSRTDYRLATSPADLPVGTAIYRNKPTGELDELIAIVQGSSGLSLSGNYFRFTADEVYLSELNGNNGFKINGININDISNISLSGAGDVNGDGFDDLIISTTTAANPNGQVNAGSSYVVFGKAGGFTSSLNISDLNGSNGFVLNGFSGTSVSGAGDVNGDGFDDLIIGNWGVDPNGQVNAGSSYVVFGKTGGFTSSLNISDLNGSNGFVLNGIDAYDLSGWSVSTTGDINGDGFDDLIIGATAANPNGQVDAGSSYVVFGKAGGFTSSLNLSALNGSNGFTINGIDAYDFSGSSVSGAGDVNGDGFDDLIIGASGVDPNGQVDAGSSYVVFGKAGGFTSSLNLSALNGSNGFTINGIDAYNILDWSVSTAGDVNGDGFDDLIIGASAANPNGQVRAGSSYVVFGKAGGFTSSLNLSALNGSNGFTINGIDAYDRSGSSVSGAGDVNGDGFDDLIIDAPGAVINGQYNVGESYVVFGKVGGFSASLNLFDISGSNGFRINGVDAGDNLVRSVSGVSGAGDVNGDGFDDLMVGGADFNSQYIAGESYVIFGRDFTDSVTNAGTAGNDILTGTAGSDVLVGGLGNDRLIGGGNIDVLYGGAGNDTLSFGATDRRINGGSGTDTLRIDGSDTIDLTTISNNKFTAFEIIDITGTGNNNLAFTRLDLLDLSDTTNRLIVNGNAGDKVISTGQGWTFGGTTTLDSVLYRQYASGAATLLVDADVTQTIT